MLQHRQHRPDVIASGRFALLQIAAPGNALRSEGIPVYRFQLIAHTQIGECIGLVGSAPELGRWDVAKCIRLCTSDKLYPLWRTEAAIKFQSASKGTQSQRVEYKYIRLGPDGCAQWEALGPNRWVPVASGRRSCVTVDDGAFGYLQPHPFGCAKLPAVAHRSEQGEGLKIVVIGSSVALGYKAWLLEGWASLLGKTLRQKYGHRLVNVSEAGANVGTTAARFTAAVAPERPDVVVISLSLGNEGFAHCPPSERRTVQRRFESGLRRLVQLAQDLGALAVLGGVYPHSDYSSEHHRLLWETHLRMAQWGVPMLDWLAAVDDGRGCWKPGISFDPAHPNTIGHRLMYEAIDLRLFCIGKDELEEQKRRFRQRPETPIYLDGLGFRVSGSSGQQRLWIANASPHVYTVDTGWQALQTALRCKAVLTPGVYVAEEAAQGEPAFLAVGDDGAIETTIAVPPGAALEYRHALERCLQDERALLFHDGHLWIVREDEYRFRVINESDHEYNIHPMWPEVRAAFKALPPGVYEDPLDHRAPFRTAMIGHNGLESRVKAPPRSAVSFRYTCELSARRRVAIVPLGDRCAVRMLLYKLGYDGPAFPFDLTRTAFIAEVADMVARRFEGMWDPALLCYSPEAGRIYHTRWTGLSFAHEVEATDDALHDLSPVHERMRIRYTARCERFWYTLRSCDEVLFVRTGVADRGGVTDLIEKLEQACEGKPFHLLVLSAQPSQEFSGLPKVVHYDLEFNPDRMYEDPGYWLFCTETMRGILNALDVSSRNLFWCPPTPPQPIPQGLCTMG
jgi:lysophospholipase L1-like esterase